MDERDVVTCFLRHGTGVLLLRRGEGVGTYRGLWGGVSGYAEGAPDEAARWEIDEETGLLDAVELVRSAAPLVVEDADRGTRWRVHPYLFDCASTAVDANEEVADHVWVQPPAILDRETVLQLWETYRAVAPTVETVRDDTDHGSAYISLRALEVLRDEAAGAVGAAGAANGDKEYEAVAALARELREARPGMAAVATRVDRVMSTADRTPAAIRDRAIEACDGAVDADDRAATSAAELLGEGVLTLSRSGTVLEALRRATPESVFVAESRPVREGVGVAEQLAGDLPEVHAADDRDVSLFVDAAIGHVVAIEPVDTVLVGADAVLEDGTVVNKVGTRLAALAAAEAGLDCYAVCSRDKITPREANLESGPPEEIYDGDASVSVHNPVFERIPATLVDVVTEEGVRSTEEVQSIAADHVELATWTGTETR